MLSSLLKFKPNILSDTHRSLSSAKNDKEYYDAYKSAGSKTFIKKTQWTNISGKASERAQSRVVDLKQFVEVMVPQQGQYLDIGCSDGSITKAMGTALGVTEICGMDIVNILDPEYGVIFIQEFGQVPDGYMKMVTSFVTIHHIPDINTLLKEVHRVLIPGGLFIIREHAFTTKESVGIVMAEHIIYDYVKVNDSDYAQVLEKNKLYPRTFEDIMNDAVTSGLEYLQGWTVKSVDYIYYAVFRKPGELCPVSTEVV